MIQEQDLKQEKVLKAVKLKAGNVEAEINTGTTTGDVLVVFAIVFAVLIAIKFVRR